MVQAGSCGEVRQYCGEVEEVLLSCADDGWAKYVPIHGACIRDSNHAECMIGR